MTPTSAYEVAHESYERCLRAPDFFGEFYRALLASNEVIPPMFENTAFPRQHRLLQHGLGLLLIFAKRRDEQLLERIALRHAPSDLDVAPALYENFADSLVEAVSRCDPEFVPSVGEAWRDALQPGLDFMASKHEAA